MNEFPGWTIQEWREGSYRLRQRGLKTIREKLFQAICNGCGKESTATRDYFAARCSKGCKTCSNKAKEKDPMDAASRCIYRGHIGNARTRGLVPLDFELWLTLIHLPCHYCGDTDSNCYNYLGKHPFRYNGIDRIDSSEGYLPDNCLPCCFVCNRMKSDFGYEKFIAHIERIHNHVKPS